MNITDDQMLSPAALSVVTGRFPKASLEAIAVEWSETLSLSILNRTWSSQCQCCGTPYLFPVNNSRSRADRRHRSRCLLTGFCSHCGRNEVKNFNGLIGYLPFARDRARWLIQQNNNKEDSSFALNLDYRCPPSAVPNEIDKKLLHLALLCSSDEEDDDEDVDHNNHDLVQEPQQHNAISSSANMLNLLKVRRSVMSKHWRCGGDDDGTIGDDCGTIGDDDGNIGDDDSFLPVMGCDDATAVGSIKNDDCGTIGSAPSLVAVCQLLHNKWQSQGLCVE